MLLMDGAADMRYVPSGGYARWGAGPSSRALNVDAHEHW